MTNTKITVLLAIAGGLGVISTKWPLTYKKIAKAVIEPILTFSGILFCGAVGYKIAHGELLPLVSKENIEKAKNLNNTEFMIDLVTYTFFLLTYLGFLYWLSHEVLNHTDKKEPE
ncbi:MAG: hypothetical protein M0T70_11525 [Geobacteraceae bacterium]|nr:hypothetical protein [Geobacteraceae bacterium]